MICKPCLVDTLIKYHQKGQCALSMYDGVWYIAKPIRLPSITERLYHAFLVLVSKAEAFQYAEDRIEEIKGSAKT